MTSWNSAGNRGQTPEMAAAELRRAFPGYEVTVRYDHGAPRFQLRSRDLAGLYCIISSDAQEIWRELKRLPAGAGQRARDRAQHEIRFAQGRKVVHPRHHGQFAPRDAGRGLPVGLDQRRIVRVADQQ
jgi:hypothetical protein